MNSGNKNNPDKTTTFHAKSTQTDGNPAFIAGSLTILLVLVLIAGKTWALAVTDSAAVLASLADSMADAVISLMNLLVIRYSLKPADEHHRYGHGKIEGIAAVFQAAIIAGTAMFLVIESVERFLNPREIQQQSIAIIIIVVSLLFSFLIVFVQRRALKDVPSLAVEADSVHYTSDIFINAGTIIVLVATMFSGALYWLDPLFAVIVAAFLLYGSRHIAVKAFNMLMDCELSPEIRQKIIDIIESEQDITGFHDLRTRSTGIRSHISFDLEMPGEFTLTKAHETARKIELHILEQFPNAEIMIHMDPAGQLTDSRHPNNCPKDSMLYLRH